MDPHTPSPEPVKLTGKALIENMLNNLEWAKNFINNYERKHNDRILRNL